jgi:hypothetical protein
MIKAFVLKPRIMQYVTGRIPLFEIFRNGYVAVSPDHPLYGKMVDFSVHGGISFTDYVSNLNNHPKTVPSDWWCFGFDTGHYYSKKHGYSREFKVIFETEKLKSQIRNYEQN